MADNDLSIKSQLSIQQLLLKPRRVETAIADGKSFFDRLTAAIGVKTQGGNVSRILRIETNRDFSERADTINDDRADQRQLERRRFLDILENRVDQRQREETELERLREKERIRTAALEIERDRQETAPRVFLEK